MQRRVCSLSRPGFTTIEALIAAVVFLLGLSGLMGALTQARNSTGQARRYMQAMDVANDLVEQMQLWSFDDKRLAGMNGVCVTDPLDKDGVLLKRGTPEFSIYVTCMRGETDIKTGNGGVTTTVWGGLKEPVFFDEQDNRTDYERYFIVRVQNVRPGVNRYQMWVKVIYRDAGEPRVVSTQAMRIQMGL